MNTMNHNCCVVTESFSSICGHVTTVIEHHQTCDMEFDPYRVGGYDLTPLLDFHSWTKTRMASASITECKCISCDALEKGASFESFRPPPNTWISDSLCREISSALPPLVIAKRRESWESYMSDQTILSQRQKFFDEVLNAALQDFIAYEEDSGDARDEQAFHRVDSELQRAAITREFYGRHQNEYLLQFRGLKNMSMRLLFDPVNPTHLTFGLLRLVKPEEISSREICGVCREVMDGENGKNVVRLFCDQHLFHENCIIPWFTTANNNTVRCPMCRTTRGMYTLPFEQWHALDQE
ncbi:hypothetical protein EAE96_007827 [Botrytis aclada]|nr:hypothetical protein EAE96_007827 [Botrytis aclada]